MTDRSLEDWLAPLPLVAILRGLHPHEAVGIGEALYENGFRIIEVPLNSPDPLDSIDRLSRQFGADALVGAGTVLSVDAASDVAAAGGRLVVMPHADPLVIRAAKSAGLFALPGFATPTEAFAALAAGADALKLFPAEANPPAVLRAMKAILPHDVAVLPVGGISVESMNDFIAAGAAGFGLGSALYKPGMSPVEVAGRAVAFRDAWSR